MKKYVEASVFKLISNGCLNTTIYQIDMGIPYNHPFAGSLFPDDLQFLKFCKNYDYYMSCSPVFSNQKLKNTYRDGKFPVMFLDDIEIHWIHEDNEKIILDKYYRRLKRGENMEPFFIWSDSQLFQRHSPEERDYIVKSFLEIPEKNRIYFKKEDVEIWKYRDFEDREDSNDHVVLLTWQDFNYIKKIFYNYCDTGLIC